MSEAHGYGTDTTTAPPTRADVVPRVLLFFDYA